MVFCRLQVLSLHEMFGSSWLTAMIVGIDEVVISVAEYISEAGLFVKK